MNLSVYKPELRPGSRKRWDLLSMNHRRKLRKVFFDELDNNTNNNNDNNNNVESVDPLSFFTCSINGNDQTQPISSRKSPEFLATTQFNSVISDFTQNSFDESTNNNQKSNNIDIDNDNRFEPLEFQSFWDFSSSDNNTIESIPTKKYTEFLTSTEQLNSILNNTCNNNYHVDCTDVKSFSENSTASLMSDHHAKSSVAFQNDNSFKNSTSDNTSNDITNYCKPTETVFSAESFKANLAKGFFNTKMNQVQSNTMLKILHTHPQLNFLPTDCRSLLKTPREKIQTKIIPPGEYLHLGLESTLKSILSLVSLESIPRELIIDFNTDGVELNKNIQLWPIQIRVINLSHDKPELIGIYEGVKKPNSFTDFFLDFVQEVKSIEEEGGIIFNGNLIYLKFRCFIADAPARAYVLNHASHVAKYPCSKCHVEGITFHKSNRFVGINHKLRTDLEYRMLSDVDHHKGKSAIHDLPINLVNQVPFDYMHLVCLGVMKKIIGSILLGTSITKKLPKFKVNIVSNRLITLNSYCPREFARKPQEIDNYSKFKATEFRQLLLFTFVVVFRGVISSDLYNHFLLLHASMRVLLNDSCLPGNLDFADEALKSFVNHADKMYGLDFLTYNIHGLLHLVSDYHQYGSLDSISAFPYENCMPTIRGYVRKPDQPLKQIHKRIKEQSFINSNNNDTSKLFKAYGKHDDGPILSPMVNNSTQYANLQTPTFLFSIKNQNNTFITNKDKIGIIKNIIFYENQYFFAVRYFKNLNSLYNILNQPSINFQVFLCTLYDEVEIIPYNIVRSKCYRMPLWVEKPFTDESINDEQLNNAFVAVVM